MFEGWGKITRALPELGKPQGVLAHLALWLISYAVAIGVLWYAESRSLLALLVVQLVLYAVVYRLQTVFYSPDAGHRYRDAVRRILPAAGLTLGSATYVLLAGGPRGADEVLTVVPMWLGALPALYLALTGLGVLFRVIQTAELPILSGYYMYYPGDAPRVTAGPFGVVRHPAYGGLARLTLAFALINGSLLALFLGVLFVFAWQPVWYGLEERELVERFGDDYREYRDARPPLLPRTFGGEADLVAAVISPRTADNG